MKSIIYSILMVFVANVYYAQQPSLVKDVNPSGNSCSYYTSDSKIVYNGNLYFIADDGVSGYELWKSDGTASGTVKVKEINASGNAIDPGLAYSDYFCIANGELFFYADDGVNGRELWKTNGTTSGTVMVKDINPGPGSSINFTGTSFGEINGFVVFAADDGVNGTEPWISDGTSAGTKLLSNINTTLDVNPIYCHSYPNYFKKFNGELFFYAGGDVANNGFWKTNGTTAGTIAVKDISPSGAPTWKSTFEEMNGFLYMAASDFNLDSELWKSDGTGAGTSLVKNISLNSTSACGSFTNVNGTLFFSAIEDLTVEGEELWKSDGTAAGTVRIKNIYPGYMSSAPHDLINFSGMLYFGANDSLHGDELWKSDGTSAGTVMVKDINVGSGGSNVSLLVSNGGILYFVATDISGDTELWKSDGTAGGTVRVANINPSGSSNPQNLIFMNNLLFFSADDGVHGTELFVYDVTTDIKENNKADVSSASKVFPNPFNEQAVLSVKSNVKFDKNNASLKIMDARGRTMQSIPVTSSNTLINRNHLPAGIYFYQLLNSSESLAKGKFIIMD